MAVGLALYCAFALTFAQFQVKGDGLVYYNLLRRFVGENPDFAFAYQFGGDIWNAPFFMVGKLLATIFGFQPRLFHVSFEEISITLASNVALIVILYLGWRILKELGLPRSPAVLLLATFGSPLFYYSVFEPAAKHAADTLYLTAACFVFLRASSRRRTQDAVLLGALAALSIQTRWGVNFAFFLVLAVAAARADRWRELGLGAATTLVVGVIVFVLPAIRGIPYYIPKINPEPGKNYVAAPAHGALVGPDGGSGIVFDPTIPVKMLVSEHRGLFLWTPLTAFAVLGYLLALKRARATKDHEGFYVALGAGSLAILCVHLIWADWDGGFSFSQRFLTGLFPLYLIGVAELVRRIGVRAYPALVAAAVWAILVAFVHNVGYDNASAADGIGRVVHAGIDNRHTLRVKIQNDAKDRWRYLWELPQGRDPKHIDGT
jgi:hypothetical protein